MSRRSLFSILWVSFFLSVVSLSAVTLSPSAPVIISMGETTGVVAVAGNSTGFVAAFVKAGDLYASFSADGGTTWETPTLVSDASGTHSVNNIPSAAANEMGFVVGWVKVPVGSSGYSAYVNFSPDGLTWDADVLVNNNDSDTPILLTANETGFVASFRKASGQQAITNFSADGGSWGTAAIIDFDNQTWLATVRPAANSEVFMLLESKVSMISGNPTTFTSTDGTNWPVVTSILPSYVPFMDISALALAGFSSNFLAGWLQSGLFKTSCSTDLGETWSDPLVVPTGLDVASPFLCGTDAGFVASWIEGGTSGKVSLTADCGVNWTSAVEIPEATFLSANMSSGSFSTQVIFTWVDGSGNAVASVMNFAPDGPAEGIGFPTEDSFFKTNQLIKSRNGLFR